MSVEYVEKVYNRYSSFYDLIFGKIFDSGREKVPELLQLEPGMHLLEVGIGTALSLPQLPRHCTVTGVDLSQKMLDEAAKRIRKLARSNVFLHKMDATQMSFPDNAFDRVLAAYFISTVPDPVAVVREMKRVCKPGGYLLFLNHFQSENPILGTVERVISPLCYRIGFCTDLNLRQLMERTQLNIDLLERIDFLGNWKAVRCLNEK
ncbi:MAG TPA: methyltransferase domain-containing protein [Acidobacteriota bacterium]|nr:methyltransferase domain-containing protein [Acidobacteriota bacterium]